MTGDRHVLVRSPGLEHGLAIEEERRRREGHAPGVCPICGKTYPEGEET